MNHTRPWLLALFVSLLCVCFLSVPVLADGGDEDPWDADDGSGGTTGGGDLGGGDNGIVTGYLLNSSDVLTPSTGVVYSNLFLSISMEVYNYLYGSTAWTMPSMSNVSKERSTTVDWRSRGNSSVR